MANMLRFFRSEPYSILEVRQGLDALKAKPMDLIPLLEKHHRYIEESLPTLADKVAPFDLKQMHLKRLLQLLAMHARAEEETLLPALMQSAFKDAHLDAIASEEEHLLIGLLVDEIQSLNYDTIWSEEIDAKARVLSNLVQNHLKNEERTTYLTAKRDIDSDLLKVLGESYLERCRIYLDIEMERKRLKYDAYQSPGAHYGTKENLWR